MLGSLLAQFGGQRVKVVPQRDNLGWRARAEQRDRIPRDRRARPPWRLKEIALVFDDSLFVERAKSDSTDGSPVTHPLRHVTILRSARRRAPTCILHPTPPRASPLNMDTRECRDRT